MFSNFLFCICFCLSICVHSMSVSISIEKSDKTQDIPRNDIKTVNEKRFESIDPNDGPIALKMLTNAENMRQYSSHSTIGSSKSKTNSNKNLIKSQNSYQTVNEKHIKSDRKRENWMSFETSEQLFDGMFGLNWFPIILISSAVLSLVITIIVGFDTFEEEGWHHNLVGVDNYYNFN